MDAHLLVMAKLCGILLVAFLLGGVVAFAYYGISILFRVIVLS